MGQECSEDDRKSFLQEEKPWVLYFWHACEQFNILQTIVTILDKSLAVNVDNRLKTTTDSARKCKLAEAEDRKNEQLFRSSLAVSFSKLSFAELVAQSAAQDELALKFETQAAKFEADDRDELAKKYYDNTAAAEQKSADLVQEAEELKARQDGITSGTV